MSRCAQIAAWLEAGGKGEVPPRLASHAEQCDACAAALDRAAGLGDGAARVRALHAPAELVQRLKALPLVAPACERAIEGIFSAMDGDLAAPDRPELLAHLRGCESCRRVWEAFATLRELGQRTVVGPRLRARLALHPSRHVSIRRQHRFFDLRLATAAAYLLAATTVLLVGDPGRVARASNAQMDRASVYARAAVENRFYSYSRRALASLSIAEGWTSGHAEKLWKGVRGMFGGGHSAAANPKAAADVVKGGNGGS